MRLVNKLPILLCVVFLLAQGCCSPRVTPDGPRQRAVVSMNSAGACSLALRENVFDVAVRSVERCGLMPYLRNRKLHVLVRENGIPSSSRLVPIVPPIAEAPATEAEDCFTRELRAALPPYPSEGPCTLRVFAGDPPGRR